MTRLDPRKWHISSMDNLYQASQVGAASRIKANFRATLTGTAALATQFFVFVLKNTVVGSVGGALRFVGVKNNAPGWKEWKTSAVKIASYIKNTLSSAWGIAAFLSIQAAENTVKHHRLAIGTVPAIQHSIENLTQAFNRLPDIEDELFVNHEAFLQDMEAFLKSKNPTCYDVRFRNEALQKRLARCETIKNNRTTFENARAQCEVFLSTPEMQRLDERVAHRLPAFHKTEVCKNQYEELAKRLNKLETRLFEELYNFLYDTIRDFESQKVFDPIDWGSLSIRSIQEQQTKLQVNNDKLESIAMRYAEIKHLLQPEQNKYSSSETAYLQMLPAWIDKNVAAFKEKFAKSHDMLVLKKENQDKTACLELEVQALTSLKSAVEAYNKLKGLVSAFAATPYIEDRYERRLYNEEALHPLRAEAPALLSTITSSLKAINELKPRIADLKRWSSKDTHEKLERPSVNLQLMESVVKLLPYLKDEIDGWKLKKNDAFDKDVAALLATLKTQLAP